MADYDEYEVTQTGKNTWKVEKRESGGGYGVIFVMIIVLALLLSQCSGTGTPTATVDPNQTAFPLSDVECSTWTSGSGKTIDGYTMGWQYGSSSGSNYYNARTQYVRLTGTIGIPSMRNGQSALDDLYTLPIAASPDYSFKMYSTSAEAEAANNRLRNSMHSTIRSEYQSIANTKNTFVLQIYGDDRLLYTSPSLYNRTAPVTFDINIAGVQNVEFYWNYPYINYGADYYGRTRVTITNLYGHTN